jgi:hypothetical protein
MVQNYQITLWKLHSLNQRTYAAYMKDLKMNRFCAGYYKLI